MGKWVNNSVVGDSTLLDTNTCFLNKIYVFVQPDFLKLKSTNGGGHGEKRINSGRKKNVLSEPGPRMRIRSVPLRLGKSNSDTGWSAVLQTI